MFSGTRSIIEAIVDWVPPINAIKQAMLGREVQIEIQFDEQSESQQAGTDLGEIAAAYIQFLVRITNNDEVRLKRIRGAWLELRAGRKKEVCHITNLGTGGDIDCILKPLEDTGWLQVRAFPQFTARNPSTTRITVRLRRVGGTFRNIRKPLANGQWWSRMVIPSNPTEHNEQDDDE